MGSGPSAPARVLAAALAATLLAGCSGRPEPRATSSAGPGAEPGTSPSTASLSAVTAAVEERVELYDGIVTGVIALVRVGDRTAVVTRGQSSTTGGGRPMRPDQTFPIASVTKPMTATVVLQLVEEGRLRLDDPVRRWLPELRGVDPAITVEQLLSHRSGLPDSTDADIRRHGFGTVELLKAAAAHGLDFRPGSDGRYANVGYAALGLLVERVLDQPLRTVLAERVLAPADMASASLGGRRDVRGHVDGRPVDAYYLRLHPAAGSVVASAADVDAFFRTLWSGGLVGADLVGDMRESRGRVAVGPYWSPDYGLGLMHDDLTCGPALGHSGRIVGFTNEAWTLESGERSAVVTVNDENADDIARSLVEVALCG